MIAKGWGRVALVASALGHPLSELVLRRGGRTGAVVAEVVCGGLVIRDVALIRSGTPGRLRRLPASLLWLEAAAAAAAAGSIGWTAVRPGQPRGGAARAGLGTAQAIRGSALGLLFGLHTVRFWIYLQPDQGRRPEVRSIPAGPHRPPASA